MQEDLGVERSEKAALERILQKGKDLMDSAIQREMGKAASLQVDLSAARQQRVRLDPPVMHASAECALSSALNCNAMHYIYYCIRKSMHGLREDTQLSSIRETLHSSTRALRLIHSPTRLEGLLRRYQTPAPAYCYDTGWRRVMLRQPESRQRRVSQRQSGQPGASMRTWTAELPGWRLSCTSRGWTWTATGAGLRPRPQCYRSALIWLREPKGTCSHSAEL